MGGCFTFGFYDGQEHWQLNPNNPVVQKMLSDDSIDVEEMGVIGIESEELEVASILFDISSSLHIPISEINEWDLNRMRLAIAYNSRKIQTERAFIVFSDMKSGIKNG